jgi:hypothetical protein
MLRVMRGLLKLQSAVSARRLNDQHELADARNEI